MSTAATPARKVFPSADPFERAGDDEIDRITIETKMIVSGDRLERVFMPLILSAERLGRNEPGHRQCKSALG